MERKPKNANLGPAHVVTKSTPSWGPNFLKEVMPRKLAYYKLQSSQNNTQINLAQNESTKEN